MGAATGKESAMSSENDYEGLIEPGEAELIARQARRFGFRDDELPDLEQEIVPKLINARFYHNGSACRRTFAINIINRQISNIRRNRRRGPRRAIFDATPLEAVGEDSIPSVDGIDLLCLRLDLEDVMARLSVEESSICLSLQRGKSQTEIARAMGVCRSTVSKRIRRLAEELRKSGLGRH
jgi:RNA polymerase sigma factor (sigma-70 family)